MKKVITLSIDKLIVDLLKEKEKEGYNKSNLVNVILKKHFKLK